MPGENWNETLQLYETSAPVKTVKATFEISKAIPHGAYIVALAILDPAGMQPSIKFATKQYFEGAIHSIGKVGLNESISHFELNPKIFDNPKNDHSLSYKIIQN